ncbi:hypothetical protein PHLCEN_2v12754 [Hermanssonia centrifuga]|uniref:Alkyl transferase n=1 Tax=Hermanssonia centrifuga TaxID=98765 RepID=A0A2R6NGK8_9APHY|nr:hypothetical protein PHLCEN_2v12754 [Hermanssonia centrifuga]
MPVGNIKQSARDTLTVSLRFEGYAVRHIFYVVELPVLNRKLQVLEICMHLNIHCVSAYAFAIENFKRSPEEVDALMTLAEEKLVEIAQHGELLDEYGVRLNVLGKTELLPSRVQVAIRKAEEMTRHNDREITEKDLDAHMMTSMVGSPPVDILVRTSGVKRLSDYLVWQSGQLLDSLKRMD